MYFLTSFPSRFLCSCVMVASTPAACSPPITEMRALGHMYRNLTNHNQCCGSASLGFSSSSEICLFVSKLLRRKSHNFSIFHNGTFAYQEKLYRNIPSDSLSPKTVSELRTRSISSRIRPLGIN